MIAAKSKAEDYVQCRGARERAAAPSSRWMGLTITIRTGIKVSHLALTTEI